MAALDDLNSGRVLIAHGLHDFFVAAPWLNGFEPLNNIIEGLHQVTLGIDELPNQPPPAPDVLVIPGGAPGADGIYTIPMPPGRAGAPYDFTIPAQGGTAPYDFGMSWSGPFVSDPPGASTWNAQTGAVHGKPYEAGRALFFFTLRDAGGHVATARGFLDISG